MLFVLKVICLILATIVPLLIAIAFFTLADRKIMASIQRRRGPSVVGWFGLLQPFADGLKLIIKEIIIPKGANKMLFIFAPWLTLVLSLTSWALIPLNSYVILSDVNLGVLALLAIASMSVYGVLIGGWASNSKYALIGAIRSAAQMISYEVSLGFTVLPVGMLAGSLNIHDIVLGQKSTWYIFPILPLGIIYFISALAETNRAPFLRRNDFLLPIYKALRFSDSSAGRAGKELNSYVRRVLANEPEF